MMSLCRRGLIFLISLQVLCLTAAGRQDRGRPDGQRADTTVSDTVIVGGAGDGAARSDSSVAGASDRAAQTADSLISRTVPDTVVDAWKKEPGMAYANDPRYWKTQREADPPSWLTRLLLSKGFSYFVYFVLGAILLYAIFRIVSENQLGAFYRRGTKKRGKPEEDMISGEEEDLDRQLQHSLDNKDYRHAVRYSYLRSLKRLDERGLIQVQGKTTNQEYLRQLRGTAQEAPFRFLTGAYEKLWYGGFDLSEDSFRRLFNYFMDFDKNLKG